MPKTILSLFGIFTNRVSKLSKQQVQQIFGDNLRKVREEKGLSQEQLGFEADLDLTSVNEIERGHRSPNLFSIYSLAKALNLNVTELFADIS